MITIYKYMVKTSSLISDQKFFFFEVSNYGPFLQAIDQENVEVKTYGEGTDPSIETNS